VITAPARPASWRENAEFAAIATLAQDWDAIAGWLVEELFHDDTNRRAFLAVAAVGGNLDAAIEAADPDAREVLARAAVADLDVDPEAEARNLIAAAVRRELGSRSGVTDVDLIREDRDARLHLEELGSVNGGPASAEWLLGWLHRRMEERSGGGI
jgi:DNA primase